MTALLCAISAPRVHAQSSEESTDQWVEDGGSIVASPMMLTVREGESAAYSVNLTAPPTAEAGNEPWWVFVHVDGQRRADGRYKSIYWVPSIGREFYRSDRSAENGKDIRIYAEEDDNAVDEVYTFTHELWDHDAYCPEGLHGEGDVARVVVTVIDDDGPNAPQPELSIGDASVEEGGTARFEVRLDTASERAVTVHYRTSNGTALADSDYERVDDTLLTIPAETRIAIIEVQTKEDDDYEADETFTVRLSSPAGATIGDGTGEGTITNDDAAPEVFIENDATVDEGDPARFVVKLSAQSVLPVRVPVATMDGTAVAGSDYTAIDRTLTFQPGTDSLTVDVSTRDDNADEPETETFTLALSAPDGATLRNNQSTGTGTIRDNDDLPEVSIGNAPAVTEGGTALFPVTLTAASGKMVTVMYRTVDGTAVAGSDYMTTTGTLEFSPGTDRLTIAVPTSDDETSEPEENFTVELSAPTEATLGENTGEGTIRDDDGQPSLSIADAEAVTEADGTATFTVTLSGMSSQVVSVAYTTRNGTATANSDYTTASGTLEFQPGDLEFQPGDMEKTVSVTVLDDNLPEDLEQFTVELSSASGATIADRSGAVTIIDDDAGGVPSLRISDATAVTEGGTARFTVTMSVAASTGVTVDYRTMGGTAVEGSDYTGTSGTLTFTAGDTTETVSVTILDDSTREPDESFSVILSNPSGAMLADDTATGTIEDNDSSGLPGLSILDATVSEGETALFRVGLSVAGTQTVTVNYETADGTATEGTDYSPTQGTLMFEVGTIEQTIAVQTVEDGTAEQTETFMVGLSGATGATLEDATAKGTITDDDGGGGGDDDDDDDDDDDGGSTPTLSLDDVSAEEGETAQFTVTLIGTSNQTVTVDVQTSDGTAEAGADYTTKSETLTFSAGQTTATFSVDTIDDQDQESDENFTVTLSNPSGATIDDDTGTGTITDNDGGGGSTPTLSIDDVSAEEGETAQFTVTLIGTSNQTVTVDVQTSDGTAEAGADYTTKSETLTFSAGQTTATFSVDTIDDQDQESDENFTVTLSNSSGATIDDDTGTGTITDNDGGGGSTPTLSIDDASAEEGETAQFTVTLTGTSTETVTVDFRTDNGTALAGADYKSSSGTLTFAAGESSKTISVETIDDDQQESQERFTVTLSNPDGAALDDATGTGTIADDDPPPTLAIDDAQPVPEGGAAEFLVRLSAVSQLAVTVAFATEDGTASAGSDYTRTTGTLRFEPGDTTRTIQVPVLEDEILEETETFSVELSDPVRATVEDGTGTAAITDNDQGKQPALSIGDAAPVVEGVTARFPVRLSAAVDQAVTVAYATADGTATEGSDYTGSDGTLTFEPGTTLLTIEVATLEDETEEPEEGFTVELSDPAGATLEDDTGVGTIRDIAGLGGSLPALSIADAAPAAEGGTAKFLVTLSAATEHVVTASYATADGTARAGADYTPATGTLRFEPGDTRRTIRVPVLDDETLEETEDFTVGLSRAAGATLADATGRGTITDDDEGKLPALSIDDAAPVVEGTTALFPVRLSAAMDQTVTVAFATVDGTARAGSDYVAAEGTLTFPPRTTRQTIEVATHPEEIVESEEGFAVELSDPTGAGLEDDAGTGTITDDDLVEGLPTLSIADAAPASEGGTAGFVVTLSAASEKEVRVSYRTVDDTATAGLDYTPTDGILRFEPGETTRTITVPTLADEVVEGAERFAVELSEPVAATIADATGVGTITEAAERIEMVNRTVLPELGRALAFTAVTCRFDRGLSGPTAGDRSQGPAGYLSLPHALRSDRQSSPVHESLTLERALGDSSFLMPMQDEEGGAGRFAAWGCGDYRRMAGGGNGAVSWDGEVFSVNVGADVRLGSNTLAGLSVSRSRSSFDYHAGGRNGESAGGAYDLRLTGVHPYLGWSVSPGLDVWGTVGHAWGELRIEDDLVAGLLRSAATLDSGAVGVSGRLLARGTTTLRLKGEGALARLDIAGDGAMIKALALNMQRLRLSTEASHEFLLSSGGSLTPWGELGLRHDGGDGETGAGLEVGGGLRYRNLPGWTTEGYGRWLAAHQGALREWGFGAMVRYDPGAAGRGPSLSLMPGWGDTASGVQRLWERGATDPTLPRAPGSRLDAQFGYGFAAFRGRGVLTPFGTVSLDGEYGRGYRLGSRLSLGRATSLSLEAERRERTAGAVHAVFVRGTLQF